MTTQQNGTEIIERIQGDLAGMVGDEMHIKANLGRSKTVQAVGILEQAHPKLFVLKVNETDSIRRLSYSYADLLTQTVRLSDVETQDNILPWLEPTS